MTPMGRQESSEKSMLRLESLCCSHCQSLRSILKALIEINDVVIHKSALVHTARLSASHHLVA
jgi:hypothetical protein